MQKADFATIQALNEFEAFNAVEKYDAVSWVLRSLSHILIIGLLLYFIVGFIYGFLVTWQFLGQSPDADFQDVLWNLGMRPEISTEESIVVTADVGTGVCAEMRTDAGSDQGADDGTELGADVGVDKCRDEKLGLTLSEEINQAFPEEALLG